MRLSEIVTEILMATVVALFKVYITIATFFATLFFPLTKHFGDKILENINIEINGTRPQDIKLLDPKNLKKVYVRCALEGMYGLAECVIAGDVDIKNFNCIAEAVFKSRNSKKIEHPLTPVKKFFNLQNRKRAWEVGQTHYDDASEAIMAMIDKNLQYTCGYWKNAANLDEAQLAKMDLVAQKLYLKPGMKVLDIGCGYGTLGYYLTKNYGVTFVGCTVSKEQVKYAEKLCAGLPCDFLLKDYRDIREKFDRIVSVGMFEHVGPKNYKKFFDVCHRCLQDDGILLLHTIGISHSNSVSSDLFIDKYIFPNGEIPYFHDLTKAFEGKWIMEDWHNFGFDYSLTLTAWEEKFLKAWPTLQQKYDETFYRIWLMYLRGCRALFSTRKFHLWQIVLTKDGLEGGYKSVR